MESHCSRFGAEVTHLCDSAADLFKKCDICATERGVMMTRKALSMAATATICVALLGLAGASATAVVAMMRANQSVNQARVDIDRVAGLRDAVSDEAFAEASFRRAPTPASWRSLEDALAVVPPLIVQLRRQVDRRDGMALSALGILNTRYSDQVRATRYGQQRGTDDRVSGPALDSMRSMLESLFDRHRAELSTATRQQDGLIRRLTFMLPAVFILAFVTLSWAWLLSRRERRQLRRDADMAKVMAHTDALTGLPNRPALLASVSAMLAVPNCQAALLLLDLDKFKPVNDTFGHQGGDEVLRQVAQRLRDATRSGDLPARLGGDEFAVMLPSGGDADAVSRRILTAFQTPFDVNGTPVDVGISIGVALTDASSGVQTQCDELFLQADQALYRAKRGGRARVEFAQAC